MNIAKTCTQAIMKAFGSLPLGFLHTIGKGLAFIMEKIMRYRYAAIITNISRSFPEKKYDEIREIAHSFYQHFAAILAEAIWFGASDTERLRKQRLCSIKNPELMDRLYNEAPSTMIMMAHNNNWEVVGGIPFYNYTDKPFPITEKNCCVTYKRLTNATWDAIMTDNRKAVLRDKDNFEGYLESSQVMRYAVKHRNEHKFYIFIGDQSPYHNSVANMDLVFMNQKTRTMSGAATLANRMGHAVVYLSCRRESMGHYSWEFKEICPDASKVSVEYIMKMYYQLLEEDIKAQPANYLWSHKRWKTIFD